MRKFIKYTVGAFALMACLPAYAGNVIIGTNGHNAWTNNVYVPSEEDKLFKMLSEKNLRSYRIDIDGSSRSIEALTRVVALGKKYNIVIRPMIYVDNNPETTAYTIAKKYAADIKVYELGNELNLRGVGNFEANIDKMILARKGIDRAASETKQNLKTTLNVTAGINDVGISYAQTSYPFVDKALQMGLKFDYISFHYYPSPQDRQNGWMGKYLKLLRQYGKTVILNETNCAQIYSGDDGNSQTCAETLNSLIQEVKANYSDMVAEIGVYELLDSKGQEGPEAHFGLMYDAKTPKKTLGLITSQAVGSYLATPYPDENKKETSGSVFIRYLYAMVLQRAPDKSGLEYWTNVLDTKQLTRRDVLTGSATSPEFKQTTKNLDNATFVNRAFLAVLGRNVDPSGYNFYKKELDAKRISHDKLILLLLGSDEFKRRKL